MMSCKPILQVRWKARRARRRCPMALLTGFVTILAVVACGAALAHLGRLDARGQRTLADLSFFVATPALMLLTISEVDLGGELGANLLASVSSLLAAAGIYVA